MTIYGKTATSRYPYSGLSNSLLYAKVLLTPVCNYFIAARLLSGNERFERVLREAGKMTRAAGDMWVLRSKQTIQQLRNQLTLAVKPHEHFIIVNASKDRLAWYNIGVENDISVRGVWDTDEVQ